MTNFIKELDIVTCVEYPGRIKSIESTLEHLDFKNADKVDLYFDKSDQWRPPIQGDYRPANALLLKVVNGNFEQGKIMGKIESFTRFRRLADFRMPPPITQNHLEENFLKIIQNLDINEFNEIASKLFDESWRNNQANLNSANSKFNWFGPPRLTPNDFPYFNVASSSTLSSSSSFQESSRRKGRQAAWTRSFGDSNIPENPLSDISIRIRRLHRDRFDVLTKLFKERPIWLRSSLCNYLPDLPSNEFRAMMPAVAYFFIDGPWRCCWVRYGYDPRKDPESRRFQVVEMRASKIQSMISMFPNSLRKSIDSYSEKHVFDGVHLISNMNQFQYCDLTYPPIQSMLNNPSNIKTFCEKKEGWYSDGTINKIRTLIKERWFELVKQEDPNFFENVTNVGVSSEMKEDGDDAIGDAIDDAIDEAQMEDGQDEYSNYFSYPLDFGDKEAQEDYEIYE